MAKSKKKLAEKKKPIAPAPARLIEKKTKQTPAKMLPSTSSEKKAVKDVSVAQKANKLQHLTRALMSVSLKLLNSDKAEEMVVRSPLSIFKTLLVVYEAAAGETQAELKEFLFDGTLSAFYYSALDKSVDVDALKTKFAEVLTSLKACSCLELATRIFYDVSAEIRKPFIDSVEELQVDFEKVNFNNKTATLKKINDFIKQGTKGKVESDVTLETLKDAGIMPIDTIYFKEQWLDAFAGVEDAEFHETTNRQRTMQMMRLPNAEFNYAENHRLRVVTLPYNWQDADGKRPFEFAIFLPLPKQLCGLSAIRPTITANEIQQLLTALKPTMLDLHVPEFEIDLLTDLKPILENAGVKELFDRRKCDLSRICAKPSFVSEAKHCAMLKVDRNGTEAAAFTRVKITFISMNYGADFICNHPFLFAILYNKIPLFLGQYV